MPLIARFLAAFLTLSAGPLSLSAVEPETASLLPYLEKVYGDVLPDVIAAKQAYAQSHGLTIWADYSKAGDPVPVASERHTLSSRLRQARGSYNPKEHKVTIHEGEGEEVRIHELGHAIQREAVLIHRRGPEEGLTMLVRDLIEPGALDRRMRYLLLQSELEVRLMQLNRAFFRAYGRPILDRQDAYLALVSAGYRLDRDTRMELRVYTPERNQIRRFDVSDYPDLEDMLATVRQAAGDDAAAWKIPALDAILTLAPAVL